MKCKSKIGVRGLCDADYTHYLDLYGISLAKASNLSDSATLNAKELIEQSVEIAWQDVFNDIRIKGFKFGGIQHNFQSKFTAGLNNNTLTLTRSCEFEVFEINKISVYGENQTVQFKVLADGVEVYSYNDIVDGETLFEFNQSINADRLDLVIENELLNTTNGTPFKVDINLKCEAELFYCKYEKYIVKAVMLKACAIILNTILFSDRYNDLILYKRDDVGIRISQLDSSYNLLNKENKLGSKGLYQLELENINDILNKLVVRCSCCFECDDIFQTKITIP